MLRNLTPEQVAAIQAEAKNLKQGGAIAEAAVIRLQSLGIELPQEAANTPSILEQLNDPSRDHKDS